MKLSLKTRLVKVIDDLVTKVGSASKDQDNTRDVQRLTTDLAASRKECAKLLDQREKAKSGQRIWGWSSRQRSKITTRWDSKFPPQEECEEVKKAATAATLFFKYLEGREEWNWWPQAEPPKGELYGTSKSDLSDKQDEGELEDIVEKANEIVTVEIIRWKMPK